MPHVKLGLRLECLRLPIRKALRKAAELGVEGVQFDAVGSLAPPQLSETGRRELLHLIKTRGLRLAALGFPTRYPFHHHDGLEARVDALQRVMELAYALRAPVVSCSAGRVPEDESHPSRQLLTEIMREIGSFGDRNGAIIALRTGSESGETLAGFLNQLDSVSIRVGMDPASLMIRGYDPVSAVAALHSFIVYCHGTDAIRDLGSNLGQFVTPGDGDVGWESYSSVLDEAGYHGWCSIEVPAIDDPALQVSRAISRLQQF